MTTTTIKPLHERRILIVEDESDTAQRIALILSRRGGAQTSCAASVRVAQELLKEAPIPDVIILDHNLGDDIGTTIACGMRTQSGATSPKIVSFSAQPREVILSTCPDPSIFDLILTKGETSLDELVRQLGLLFGK
jgi:CheY-like chemotaxis protein